MSSSATLSAKILSKFASWWPRSWVRWLGSLLGILWFDILRIRRGVVMSNLDIAFPDKDRAWKTKIGRTALRRFGANFAELFQLPSMDEEWIRKNAVFEGWENLERAKAQGKGVYILSLHMGAYDMASSLMSIRGYETYLISKFIKNRWLNDLWFQIRGAKGMKFIDAHGSKNAFEILKAIKSNAGVIFVLDQFMGRPYGIENTFFGHKTGTAYGLSLFVMKTGSPVIPIYGVQGKDGKLHLVCEPEVETASLIDDDKDASQFRLTQRFTDVIEAIVRKYPQEWLWVHKRWKGFYD